MLLHYLTQISVCTRGCQRRDVIPTILPWLWTVVLFYEIYLIYIFIYNQLWSSDHYKRLGYEEAHNISKKEEQTPLVTQERHQGKQCAGSLMMLPGC